MNSKNNNDEFFNSNEQYKNSNIPDSKLEDEEEEEDEFLKVDSGVENTKQINRQKRENFRKEEGDFNINDSRNKRISKNKEISKTRFSNFNYNSLTYLNNNNDINQFFDIKRLRTIILTQEMTSRVESEYTLQLSKLTNMSIKNTERSESYRQIVDRTVEIIEKSSQSYDSAELKSLVQGLNELYCISDYNITEKSKLLKKNQEKFDYFKTVIKNYEEEILNYFLTMNKMTSSLDWSKESELVINDTVKLNDRVLVLVSSKGSKGNLQWMDINELKNSNLLENYCKFANENESSKNIGNSKVENLTDKDLNSFHFESKELDEEMNYNKQRICEISIENELLKEKNKELLNDMEKLKQEANLVKVNPCNPSESEIQSNYTTTNKSKSTNEKGVKSNTNTKSFLPSNPLCSNCLLLEERIKKLTKKKIILKYYLINS